jgi:hypothetical protein
MAVAAIIFVCFWSVAAAADNAVLRIYADQKNISIRVNGRTAGDDFVELAVPGDSMYHIEAFRGNDRVCDKYVFAGDKEIKIVELKTLNTSSEKLQAIDEKPQRYSMNTGKRDWRNDIGLEMAALSYKEPNVMEENGFMCSLFYKNIFRNEYAFRLDSEARAGIGQMNYNGALSDGTPLSIAGIPDYLLEIRSMAGCDLCLSGSGKIALLAGLGYRYLNDNLQEKNVYGYKRESNYIYSPVKVEITSSVNDESEIALAVEYDKFWAGLQKSYIGSIYPGLSNLENRQNSGYGLRCEFHYSIKTAERQLDIKAFVRYWNIAQSELSAISYNGTVFSYGMEPENNSVEYGLGIALIL